MRIIAFVGSPVEDNEKDVSFICNRLNTCLRWLIVDVFILLNRAVSLSLSAES